jgi:Protein kinase domain
VPPDPPKDALTTDSVTGDATVQTLDRASEPEIGAMLGPFRIEARIGEGGIGRVYRAYDVKLARPVAIKVLLEASSARAAPRLLAEARAAASLTHASIAAIHDVQQRDGLVFIVMELVPGETLRAEIRRGPIPPEIVLGHARDIAAGLSRAHAAGIVHRDLKPENVMITPEGAAKILDFGLARENVDGPAPSGRGGASGIFGTPSYMAPEQARGDRADARADVFAFGIVTYEMLTGKRPFAAARAGESSPLDWRVVAPLADAAPRVPRELAAVVERCLAIRRNERFADGTELLGALRSLPESPPRSRTNRWTRLVPTVVAAALACALGVVTLRPKPAVSGPPVASSPAAVAEDPRVRELQGELEGARSVWRAGDDGKAQAMLEGILGELDRSGVRAPSPLARVGAAATLLLGAIAERRFAAPPPIEPVAYADLDPTGIRSTQNQATDIGSLYAKVGTWGALDLAVCASYRAGRTYEKFGAIARDAEARALRFVATPDRQNFYPGGAEQLRLSWSGTVGVFSTYAAGSYDGAVTTARFVDGTARDPEDGTDCRAAAASRREALRAEALPP